MAEPDSAHAGPAAMMLAATLDAMARGGIYDQLAGGFHRYATDREWKVPHFEKMLYDNGLLLEVYAREFARSGNPEAARIVRETAGFLAREMTLPDPEGQPGTGGAFWSAIDAETGGREGAYYVWTRDELDLGLGAEGSTFLAPIFGFHAEPFFEENRYVLHLPRALDVQAKERRLTREELLAEIAPLRAKLLAVRSRRRRPATDDKILADWNGTAIAGLAVAGKALAEPAFVEQARRAADFVLANLRSPTGRCCTPGGAAPAGSRPASPTMSTSCAGSCACTRPRASRAGSTRPRGSPTSRSAAWARRAAASSTAPTPPTSWCAARRSSTARCPGRTASRRTISSTSPPPPARTAFSPSRSARCASFAPLVTRHPEGAKTMALALARFARAAPKGSFAAGDSLRSGDVVAGAALFSVKGGSGSHDDLESAAQQVVEVTLRSDLPDTAGRRPFVLTLVVAEGWHLDESLRVEGVDLELDPASMVYPQPEVTGEPGSPLYQQAFRGKVIIAGRARSTQGGGAEAAVEAPLSGLRRPSLSPAGREDDPVPDSRNLSRVRRIQPGKRRAAIR